MMLIMSYIQDLLPEAATAASVSARPNLTAKSGSGFADTQTLAMERVR
jgi:hypothetical protein